MIDLCDELWDQNCFDGNNLRRIRLQLITAIQNMLTKIHYKTYINDDAYSRRVRTLRVYQIVDDVLPIGDGIDELEQIIDLRKKLADAIIKYSVSYNLFIATS